MPSHQSMLVLLGLQGTSALYSYAFYDGGCSGANELGVTENVDEVATCAASCDSEALCVSFEYSTGKRCQLSSSCTQSGAEHVNADVWDLYVKESWLGDSATPARLYSKSTNRACPNRNDLGVTEGESINTCAARCSYLGTQCVSFEFKNGKCQLSSTCTSSNDIWSPGWDIYYPLTGATQWTNCAQENDYCECPGGTARFGAEASWFTLPGSQECSTAIFDDPLFDTLKTCDCGGRGGIAPWVHCAEEDGYCECSQGTVRYGAGTTWVHKLGSQSCSNDVFTDPLFDMPKTCQCGPYDASAAASGDPHLALPHGGVADFRGEHKALYNVLSAANLSLNVMTELADFELHPSNHSRHKDVHGSFLTEAHAVARTSGGRMVRISFWAAKIGKANIGWANGTVDEQPAFVMGPKAVRQIDDVTFQMSYSSLHVLTAEFEIVVTPRAFRLERNIVGLHHRLDLQMKLLVPEQAMAVAPHGIIGQGWDGDGKAVDGERDVFPPSGDFRTSAQAKGAIEGIISDYKVASRYSTAFKFSRFDAASASPRNVTELVAASTLSTPKRVAGYSEFVGSTERAAADDDAI